jgi:putative DNA primase/helicase
MKPPEHDDKVIALASKRAAETERDEPRPPVFADDALALRFAEQHSRELRYVALWSRWMLWDGVAWKSDDTRLAFSFAREVCRKAASECDKAKLAVQLASAKTRAAVIVLANDDRRLAATSEQWDFDLDLFNTRSSER